MTKRVAIALLVVNLLAVLGGAGLVVLFSIRIAPDSGVGVTPERIDVAAARLAAQPSPAAIAEALHRDDSYIRSLRQLGRAQHTLLYWSAFTFAAVALFNLLHVVPAFRKSNRDASQPGWNGQRAHEPVDTARPPTRGSGGRIGC